MNHVYLKTYRSLENIIHILATDPGDIRSRLKNTIHKIGFLEARHFPEKLVNDWKWIINELTKFGDTMIGLQHRGLFENTLNKIKNSTGTKIAEKVYQLKEDLEEYI